MFLTSERNLLSLKSDEEKSANKMIFSTISFTEATQFKANLCV